MSYKEPVYIPGDLTVPGDLYVGGDSHVSGDAYVSGNDVISENIILPNTQGYGIKVDLNGEVFPWHDLLGAISIRGVGATDPAYNVYVGGIRGYQFAVNDEVFIEYHVPHDLVPSSDIHLHFHWSQRATTKAAAASGTVTGGTVTWGAEVAYAKGHQQAAFPSSAVTITVQQTCDTTTRYHHIAEVQLSAASPSASQLNSGTIEVDGVILCRAYLSANNITVSSGSAPAPFLHFVDIHYQSTGVGTRNKAPDFWGHPWSASATLGGTGTLYAANQWNGSATLSGSGSVSATAT